MCELVAGLAAAAVVVGPCTLYCHSYLHLSIGDFGVVRRRDRLVSSSSFRLTLVVKGGWRVQQDFDTVLAGSVTSLSNEFDTVLAGSVTSLSSDEN